jgi:hypothetical protein
LATKYNLKHKEKYIIKLGVVGIHTWRLRQEDHLLKLKVCVSYIVRPSKKENTIGLYATSYCLNKDAVF